MKTRREQILQILRETRGWVRVKEICSKLGILDEQGVYNDLKHIARTVSTQTNRKQFISMLSPRCINCGYEFRKVKEPRCPSKCPKCKSERIDPPAFGMTITKKTKKGYR
ncbi:MAG: transcriptional regulator [Candidatus Hodarchaeota archaeon]